VGVNVHDRVLAAGTQADQVSAPWNLTGMTVIHPCRFTHLGPDRANVVAHPEQSGETHRSVDTRRGHPTNDREASGPLSLSDRR